MKKYLCNALVVVGLLCPMVAVQAAEADSYIMNGGDVLNIQVFDNPDLSSPKDGGGDVNPYIIRPDGIFSMPLIGDINAKGKTTFAVTNEIVARLSEYLRDPIVTINVVKEGTTRVYVLGEVKRQGLYELPKSHTLLDALGTAAGFTEYSNKKNVFVVRNGQRDALLKVNVAQLLKSKKAADNVVLNDGDCVFLSSNNKVDFGQDIYPFFRGAYLVSEALDNMSSGDDNYKKQNISGGGDNTDRGPDSGAGSGDAGGI